MYITINYNNNNLITTTIMSIFYSKTTKQKLVVIAKTAIQEKRMAITYGLKRCIFDFERVYC